jgi:sugar lactone lactonase YvrE
MIRLSKAEPPPSHTPRIEAVVPDAVLPGAEVEIRGTQLAGNGAGPDESGKAPIALLDGRQAALSLSRPTRLRVRIPEAAGEGRLEVRRNGTISNKVQIKVGRMLTDVVHPVSSPAVDAHGNVYATKSGSRGEPVPVSVYRISPEGDVDSFMTGLVNATGLAIDGDGALYVSSRHEGTIHRVTPHGAASVYAEGMGVATGLAFDAEGNLYCGDRSGTIFRIARDRQIFVYATLEPSVAAYHLAFGLDGTLFVTGPTTSSYDVVHAIDSKGTIETYYRGLGRPQGLALDIAGNLYVAASFRGQRGVVRITPEREAELVVSGSGIVGLAFIPNGSVAVATHTSIYDVALGVEGLRLD